MDKLTVGQRIDVYEVVEIQFKYHRFSPSDQIACSIHPECMYPVQPADIKSFMGAVNMALDEVKKCGYYLKVKEVKNA